MRHRARVKSGIAVQSTAIVLLTLAAAGGGSSAEAAAPPNSVVKVANGDSSASVDNGWVIFKPANVAPSLRRFVQDNGGSFHKSGPIKIKTNGLGVNNAGLIFAVGGIVFVPCPVANKPSRCETSESGTPGVGLGFGQLTFGGLGAGAGGWVTDATVKAQATNLDQNPGAIADVAADAANGAYAVGRDSNTTTSHNEGVVLTLNEAAGTYAVTAQRLLGTLGGATSEALDINKAATFIVGDADDAAGNGHAVYAHAAAGNWIDITTGFPAEVIQSKATAVNDAGFIAGTATVKRNVGGKNRSVNIGFVYNINTAATTFFEAGGADIVPLAILAGGQVVGNLVSPSTASPVKVQHPFMYDGTVHDYGTMTLSATGLPAYGCRVNKPNNLGELAGTCIPDNTTQYSVDAGFAFYLDTSLATPAFVDLNTTLHTNADATVPTIKKYLFATATSIDDQHEITLNSRKSGTGGGAPTVLWLTSKQAYNPAP